MRIALVVMLVLGAAGAAHADQADVPGNDEDSAAPYRPAEREVPSPITDRFSIRGTYYNGSVDTIFRLDDPDGTSGTLINAEDELGLDDQIDLGRLELYFRFGQRGRLRADYFKINRFARTTLERTIEFGEDTFVAGERVETQLDLRSLAFTYTYSFWQSERFEVGAGLGLHLLEVKAIGEAIDRLDREEESGIAPFPTVALDGTYRISDRFAVTARAQYFSASVEEVEGSLTEFHLDVQYRWKPNLTVGLGYWHFDVDFTVDDDDFPGLFNLETQGPELFFRASF